MSDTVLEEVRRAVAACIPTDTVLRIRSVAAGIAARAKEEQVTAEAVAEFLLEAGVAAGIPIELEAAPRKPR